MPKSVDRSLIRLSLQEGEIAVHDSRLVRIEARHASDIVRICDLASGEQLDVSVESLRARSVIAYPASIDTHLESARAADGVRTWSELHACPQASSLEYCSKRLPSHCRHLFDCKRPRRDRPIIDGINFGNLVSTPDPATRRTALWLIMQVIRTPVVPGTRGTLRLGRSAHEEFLQSAPHSGRTWLAEQSKQWPSAYRTQFWNGHLPDDDSFKSTNDRFRKQ